MEISPGINLTKNRHLLGLFNRSIMLMENGISPCWVFDGKPPEAKYKVLQERKKKKETADEHMEVAKDAGDNDRILKLAGQSVRVTGQMTQDAKNLIRLLGLPVIEAPTEAEAQCAVMAKAGIVYAVATEDTDCLTFGSPILLRGFSNKDEPVIEVRLETILEKLDMTMEQFIDMCILCGCDYTEGIDGIGSIKAHKLINEYKTIEGVLDYVKEYNLDTKKKKKLTYDPETFIYETARKLFKEPEVINPNSIELKWTTPDYEGLKKFLCDEKQFNPGRIESAMKRIEVLFI
jgi:flap endonuclease-1